jgi:hypothetical protein
MKKILVTLLIVFSFAFAVFAQKEQPKKPTETSKNEIVKIDNAALDLAKSAVAAHGGDKFKNMKTLVVRGSVDITTSAIAQAIPATFATIFSGDKYRIDINNPFTPFQQVFDGEQTSSSLRGGFTLPPLNRLGLPLLQKLGEKDFVVSAFPDDKKKKKGFRITSPEGFFTDFYLDEKTNQIKSYDSSYEINDRNITTNVEIDKYKIVDGVVVPERYAQRFDMGELTAYADFKAKEILVNSEVADGIFALGK